MLVALAFPKGIDGCVPLRLWLSPEAVSSPSHFGHLMNVVAVCSSSICQLQTAKQQTELLSDYENKLPSLLNSSYNKVFIKRLLVLPCATLTKPDNFVFVRWISVVVLYWCYSIL